MSKFSDRIETLDEQRELFLWKFRDITREEVSVLEKQFRSFDTQNRGELDEQHAMRMFERRGSIKTAKELRQLVAAMDSNNNKKLSFVEWLCTHFGKSIEDLNDFVDEDARARAMEEAMRHGAEAKAIAEAIERAKQQKELQASLRAAAIERESKMEGVAGMRAFFFRRAESAADCTKTNEQTIKEEAARRRALREANQKLEIANKEIILHKKSAAEVEREVREAAERQKQMEAAAEKKKVLDELAARAARKAALNAQWESTSSKKN